MRGGLDLLAYGDEDLPCKGDEDLVAGGDDIGPTSRRGGTAAGAIGFSRLGNAMSFSCWRDGTCESRTLEEFGLNPCLDVLTDLVFPDKRTLDDLVVSLSILTEPSIDDRPGVAALFLFALVV